MLSPDAHRLTEGNIFKGLLRFTIPALLGNFLTSLYGAADVFIISYFADSSALSATATGAQAVFTLMAFAIGLAIGGSILIGQYFGAKNNKDVLETMSTFLTLLFGMGITCSILMLCLAGHVTNWLKTPQEAWEGARQYILICGGGIIFTFAYEGISAILRGLGDSKNPLKFVAIACGVNVLLDLLFIGVFEWGARGAATATILSQSLSVLTAIIYLKRKNFVFDFKPKSFKFHKEKAKMILKLSIPSSIQGIFIIMSFTIMTMAVNKFGVIASAVLGITNRIDGFLIMPAMAFGGAVSVMAAQNMGAKLRERAKQSFYAGFLMSLAFSIPAFCLMYFKPEWLMQMVSSDPKIIESGAEFMLAYSPDCLILGIVFCLNGFFNGCGRTLFTMGNNILTSLGLRIPLIFMAGNLFEVGLVMPIATFPQIGISLAYFYCGKWKKYLISGTNSHHSE
ncbi:MAG: MATE family efflux transporter [Alphaproteobacteria bacterium]|nr:MATE family efflux transporter [Alphaproteobacteria bacterium]